MKKHRIKIITGWSILPIKLAIWGNVLAIAISESRSITQLSTLFRVLLHEKTSIYGDHDIRKLVKSAQGYQFGLNVPPWPSKAFNRFFRFTICKILDQNQVPEGAARMVLIGITKKCPLNCEHCYEWNEINKREVMTDDFLVQTLTSYAQSGASLFWLGGGEPLSRLSGIHEILKYQPKGVSIWLSSSGYGLTLAKAKKLSKQGLTGIIISLDHYEEEQHNTFRGNRKSFQYATEAVAHAIEAGLSVGLSLCTTRSICRAETIHAYMDFAKKLGVGFVQWLEPRAAGRYEGQDVELSQPDFELLDTLYLKYSFNPKYASYPSISHPGYPQRIVGCGAAGFFNLYVDTDGEVHACPFCRKKTLSDLPEIGSCEKYAERTLGELTPTV